MHIGYRKHALAGTYAMWGRSRKRATRPVKDRVAKWGGNSRAAHFIVVRRSVPERGPLA